MTCKGICVRHKAKKPVNIGRYASGQRRCQICEIFIKWNGLWCPCCGYRLRGKPRNVKYKERLNETEFRSGAVVKIYKDWRHCRDFQFKAVLVELLEPTIGNVGATWLIRKLEEFKKNPQCMPQKRIINIADKDKVLV